MERIKGMLKYKIEYSSTMKLWILTNKVFCILQRLMRAKAHSEDNEQFEILNAWSIYVRFLNIPYKAPANISQHPSSQSRQPEHHVMRRQVTMYPRDKKKEMQLHLWRRGWSTQFTQIQIRKRIVLVILLVVKYLVIRKGSENRRHNWLVIFDSLVSRSLYTPHWIGIIVHELIEPTMIWFH